MRKYRYAVIILNFNTAEDSIKAANSVISSSLIKDFIICIVDNASPNIIDKEKLRYIDLPNTKVIFLEKNTGYACGNNEGIRRLSVQCEFEYTIIMNPDVLINQVGTIEELIHVIEESNSNIVGAQPLINKIDLEVAANKQINIRRTWTYSDCLMNAFWLFKRIFKQKFDKTIYKSEMPYVKKMAFEVPCGAFFLIKTNVFNSVDLFDEMTFLYCEEPILGKKLKDKGFQFILVPEFCVNHYQGKSTGSHKKLITKFSLDCEIESTKIYLKNYLGVGKFKISIVNLLMLMSYYTKQMVFRIPNLFKREI